MSVPLSVGIKAPLFSLLNQNGEKISFDHSQNTWTLLYFYPKDNTPGCTEEACAIRDDFPAFTTKGLTVIGISADSVKSHKKFQEKYHLPFTLLSDEHADVSKVYGVWQKKKFMGREYEGIVRSSFLISPNGYIAKIYENVTPATHAQDVLSDLSTLTS